MEKQSEREKRNKGLFLTAFFVLFLGLLTVLLWKPFLSLFQDPETFRLWVEEKGWGARGAFVGMMILQVIVALIPGEPLEIAAGFAFGSVEGTILVLLGIAIGSILIFLIVRLLGRCLPEIFFSAEKIQSLHLLQKKRRFERILFLLMFIPGTPKDLLTYFLPLSGIRPSKLFLIVTVARIPSVLTSTVGGNALGERNYLFAFFVFAVTALISLGGAWLYDCITRQKNGRGKEKSDA